MQDQNREDAMNILQLADAYLTDPDSGFPKLRFCTREGYQRNIAKIIDEIGDREIAAIGAKDLLHLHAKWMEGGHIASAHQLATQLRIIIGFGATILEDADCQRVRGLLAGLRFKNAKPRTTWITAEQVKAVREEAFCANWLSVALAQAFQFDCALRQRDVLGEWIPADEPEPSTIYSHDRRMKWVRGITREEVNADMVLTHKTSKRGQVLTFPLKSCPSVMTEWYAAPPSGPLIIDPQTELPFEAWKYRRIWREMATKAGVPPEVWNMDSRAGRITQVLAAGASLEDARKLAGHNQSSTTSRYSRGTPEAIARALNATKGE
jgi:hypothetical protein